MTRKHFSPALAVMIGLLVWSLCDQLRAAMSWGHDSWPMSEWLINYAGGFIRRGLTGSLTGQLAQATGIQANHLAILAGFGCYLGLVGWFLRRATPTFPAVLVLSCIAMGFPAYQDSIVRKDCLGLLLLLGCLAATDSRLRRPLRITLINVLAAMAILSHEAFAFYGLPALVVFGRRDREAQPSVAWVHRAVLLAPAAACCVLVAMFHGSPAAAQAVHDSWLPLWRVIEPANAHLAEPAAAIQALGWNSEQGLSPGINLLTSGFYQPMAWACLFAVSFVLILIFTERDADRQGKPAMEARIRVSAILLAQLVFIAPLFLLGHDYGRWLFFWVASSLMLHTAGRSAPRWMEAAVLHGFNRARLDHLLARIPAQDWYLLFFGIPACWNLHSFIAASPVIRHVLIIRSWW